MSFLSFYVFIVISLKRNAETCNLQHIVMYKNARDKNRKVKEIMNDREIYMLKKTGKLNKN